MIRHAPEMQSETRVAMRGGNGSVAIRHLFKPEEISAKTRLTAVLTLPPGASIGPHQHQGEDEVYYIVKGRGMLDDGTQQTIVGPGDAILTGNGQTHAIANAGDSDLEVLAVIMLYA